MPARNWFRLHFDSCWKEFDPLEKVLLVAGRLERVQQDGRDRTE